MSQTRRSIAQNVLDHLVAVERSTDQALIDTAELVTVMLKARRDLDASAVFGQEAFEYVTSTFAAHAESRRQIVAAHNALVDVKAKIGLATIGLGGAGNKEVSTFSDMPTLSIVTTRAA